MRLPATSPVRYCARRLTPPDHVAPFVSPTNSRWEPSHLEFVREVPADAPFYAWYRYDQTTLPNQARHYRCRRPVHPVSEPPLTAAEYIGQSNLDGYLYRPRVAAMLEVRRSWDDNLDQSTVWARKWSHWLGRGVLDYDAYNRGDSPFVWCREDFLYQRLVVSYLKALAAKKKRIGELRLSDVWFERPHDDWYGLARKEIFGDDHFNEETLRANDGIVVT